MTATARRKREVLDVAAGVQFGFEYVTKTAAILAQRRKGKTYTGAVIAEELYACGLPWVALDPTGAWWGLRSSADGRHPGLPVVIVGGEHADLPLERGAGAFVADLVVDHPGWYVLDLSLLESRNAEREFSLAFAQRLHRRKMQPGMDFPLHLFVDEADLFVPQEREVKLDNFVLGAFQGIVRRGGLHGLGTTLISQRPALVNKSVLTQLDLLILLRLVAGQDQDAVDKNYIARASTREQRAELMGSLASLPVGTAWFFEPGAEPDPLFARAQVGERRTFNSSATPKPGEKRVEPTVFAEIDLERVGAQMQAAIERAKDDDPAELRRRIRDLERRRPAAQEPERVEVPVEVAVEVPFPVPMLTDEERDALRRFEEGVAATLEAVEAEAARQMAPFREMVERINRIQPDFFRAARGGASAEARGASVAALPVPARRPADVRPDRERAPGEGLTRPQTKILDAVAWWVTAGIDAPSVGQVAFVVGSHARSKGFTNNLSALSGSELIVREPGRVRLTAEGAALAAAPPMPPTDEALQGMIYAQVGPRREQILRILIGRAGRAFVPLEDLADAMGYHARSKGFTNNVSSLSGLGLVERESGRVRASDLCFVR